MKSRKLVRRLLINTCGLAITAGLISPAFAQTEASPNTDQAAPSQSADDAAAVIGTDDIVVTARGVTENLRDVPATVSVLTSDAIQASGVTVATDFVQLTAGVTIVTGNVEAGDVQISIRGINGTRDAESNVALVVDGVLKTNTAALNQNAGTLDQIEILKGPQGAIYGRNASSGAIVLTTKRPGDRIEGKITMSLGEYAHRRAAGYISSPLGSQFGVLLSGDWEKGDGFYTNVFQNTPQAAAYRSAIQSLNPGADVPSFGRHTVDNFERWNLNARVIGQIGDRTELDLKGKYGKTSGGTVVFGVAFSIPSLVPFVGPSAYQDVNKFDFSNAFQGNLRSLQRQESKEASLKLTHEFDWARMQAWAAYSNITNAYTAEGTSGGNGYFFRQPACRATTAALQGYGTTPPTFIGGTPETSFFGSYSPTTCDGYQYNQRDQEDFSGEIRLSSLDGGDLSWQGGAYFLHIDRRICVNLGTDNGLGPIRQCFTLNPKSRTEALSDDKFRTKVYAGFGSVQNKFTDNLTAAVALRYDIEQRHTENQVPTDIRTLYVNPQGDGLGNYFLNPGLDPLFNPSGVLAPRSKTFKQLQPKVSLTYEPSPALTFFANWGKGFKSGGFNSGGSEAIVNTFNRPPLNANVSVRDDYKKEVSTAFEAGFKGAFLDGRINLEGAAYHSRVSNMQFFEFFVGSFGLLRTVSNIDSARLYGFEGSANLRIVPGWTIFSSGNITKSKILKNSSRPDTVGNKVPYASDYTINVGTQLAIPVIHQFDLTGRVDYRLTGPTWFHTVQGQFRPTLNGPGEYSVSRRDAFGIVNARIGLSSKFWNVSLYGNNLLNKKWIAEVVTAPELGGSFVSPGTFREVGLETVLKF